MSSDQLLIVNWALTVEKLLSFWQKVYFTSMIQAHFLHGL